MTDLTEAERRKYETVWGDYPDYRCQADGDPVVDLAYRQMGCKPGESLIDWGCGKGTPAAKFKALGLRVTGFDIAKNCLDPGIDIPLVVGCLWDPPYELPSSDYAFCTDVLEHLPPEKVDLALSHMYHYTHKAAFIQVCTVSDTFGKKMNPRMTLHLTVGPLEWWRAQLEKRWSVESFTRGKARAYFICFK